jgi:tetratricopeptide (TPR) repeat protein
MNERSLYDELQVSRSASDGVIKAAYKALSQKFHPDKNPTNRLKAELEMKAINAAYAVLSHGERRRRYDASTERSNAGASGIFVIPKGLLPYSPYAPRASQLHAEGMAAEAVYLFEAAIAANWSSFEDSIKCYQSRAHAYKLLGLTGPEQAILQYGKAVHATRRGDFDFALNAYMQALRHDPAFLWTANNIAWLRATCADDSQMRDGREAIRYATIACEGSEWNSWSFVDTLGAAYAEAGDFASALAAMDRSASTAPEEKSAEIRTTIQSFRAGIKTRTRYTIST